MKEFGLPVYPMPVTFGILFIAMILRYFLLEGLAFKYSKKFPGLQIAPGKENSVLIKHDVFWSLVSTLIFSASGTLLIYLWQQGHVDIYSNPDKFGRWYFIITLFVLMFFHDFYFYWTHRLLHIPSLYQKFHKVHHESH